MATPDIAVVRKVAEARDQREAIADSKESGQPEEPRVRWTPPDVGLSKQRYIYP